MPTNGQVPGNVPPPLAMPGVGPLGLPPGAPTVTTQPSVYTPPPIIPATVPGSFGTGGVPGHYTPPAVPSLPSPTPHGQTNADGSMPWSSAAKSIIGSTGGPAGCAVTVGKIAGIANVPVPKTANAGEFEKNLPSMGWIDVTDNPNRASLAQIVTIKGSDGHNNPSGRHVMANIGQGYGVHDPGKSSGYRVVQGRLPTNDPSAKYWRWSGSSSPWNPPGYQGAAGHPSPDQTVRTTKNGPFTDVIGSPLQQDAEAHGKGKGVATGQYLNYDPSTRQTIPNVGTRVQFADGSHGIYGPTGNKLAMISPDGKTVKVVDHAGLKAYEHGEVAANMASASKQDVGNPNAIAQVPNVFKDEWNNSIVPGAKVMATMATGPMAGVNAKYSPEGSPQRAYWEGQDLKSLQNTEAMRQGLVSTAKDAPHIIKNAPTNLPAWVGTHPLEAGVMAFGAADAAGSLMGAGARGMGAAAGVEEAGGGAGAALGAGAIPLTGPVSGLRTTQNILQAGADVLKGNPNSASLTGQGGVAGVGPIGPGLSRLATNAANAAQSQMLNVKQGDFVVSRSNPKVFGRVIDQNGSALNRTYVVQGPEGIYSVPKSDLSQHIAGPKVDAAVSGAKTAAGINVEGRPELASKFGRKVNNSWYEFKPEEEPHYSNAQPRNDDGTFKEGKPITPPPAPHTPEPPTPTGIGAPGMNAEPARPVFTPPRIGAPEDLMRTEGGGYNTGGQFIPSSVRPTPYGPTSAGATRPPGVVLNRYGVPVGKMPLLENNTLSTGPEGSVPYRSTHPGTFVPTNSAPRFTGTPRPPAEVSGLPAPYRGGNGHAVRQRIPAETVMGATPRHSSPVVGGVPASGHQGTTATRSAGVGVGTGAAAGVSTPQVTPPVQPMKTAFKKSAQPTGTPRPLPAGQYKPAVSKSHVSRGTTRYGGVVTTIHKLVGKQSGADVVPSHVVVSSALPHQGPANGYPSSGVKDWHVFTADPNGSGGYIAGTNVGLGDHVAGGLTEKQATDRAQKLSGGSKSWTSQPSPTHNIAPNAVSTPSPMSDDVAAKVEPGMSMKHIADFAGANNVTIGDVQRAVRAKSQSTGTDTNSAPPSTHLNIPVGKQVTTHTNLGPRSIVTSRIKIGGDNSPIEVRGRTTHGRGKGSAPDPKAPVWSIVNVTGDGPTDYKVLETGLPKTQAIERAKTYVTGNAQPPPSSAAPIASPPAVPSGEPGSAPVPPVGRASEYPSKPNYHFINGHTHSADYEPKGWQSDRYRVDKRNGSYDVTRESDRTIVAHVGTLAEANASAKRSIQSDWERFKSRQDAFNGTTGKFKKSERGSIVIPAKVANAIGDALATAKTNVVANLGMTERHGGTKLKLNAQDVEGAKDQAKTFFTGPGTLIARHMKGKGGLEHLTDLLRAERLHAVASKRWEAAAREAMQGRSPVISIHPGETTLHPDDLALLHELDHNKLGIINGKALRRAARVAKTGNDLPVREFLRDTYNHAAMVAHANAKGMASDAEMQAAMKDPDVAKSVRLWIDHANEPMSKSHASNSGIFHGLSGPMSDNPAFMKMVGHPVGTPIHIPLTALDENGELAHSHTGPSNPAYSDQPNRSNKFTTGQAHDYDRSIDNLRNHMANGYRRNAIAVTIKEAKDRGLLQPESNGKVVKDHAGNPVSPPRMTIKLPDGSEHVAVRIPTTMQGDHMLAPKWFADEMGPILGRYIPGLGQPGRAQPPPGIDKLNSLYLQGPVIMTVHVDNLASVLGYHAVMSHGWPGAIIGHSVPFAQRVAAIYHGSKVDVNSPSTFKNLHEIAKIGHLHPHYAQSTFSEDEAATTGATLAKPIKVSGKTTYRTKNSDGTWRYHVPSYDPLIYGRNGADTIGRITLYRLALKSQGLKPDESLIDANNQWIYPEKMAKVSDMMSELIQYHYGLMSTFERNMKTTGAQPVVNAAKTMTFTSVRRLIGWGALIAAASFLLVYKAYTGHYFGQGKDDKIGYMPIDPHDYSKGQWSWGGAVSPMLMRGLSATGATGFGNALIKGHGPGEAVDQGLVGQANAAMHIGVGPGAAGIMSGFVGAEPSFKQIDDWSPRGQGKGSTELWGLNDRQPLPNTIPAVIGRHFQNSIESIPLVGGFEQLTGLGAHGQETASMSPGMRLIAGTGGAIGVPVTVPHPSPMSSARLRRLYGSGGGGSSKFGIRGIKGY